MNRKIEIFILSLISVAVALILTGLLQPGFLAVAEIQETPFADGQQVEFVTATEALQQPAIPAIGSFHKTYGSYQFRPVDSELTFSVYGAAMYAVNLPAGGVSFKCPIDLPEGAQVLSVSFFIVDNSETDDMILQLYRTQPSANTSQYQIGSVSSAGLPTTAAVQTITINGSPILTTIDNFNYNYHLRYGPSIAGSLHRLVGARIDYNLASSVYIPYMSK